MSDSEITKGIASCCVVGFFLGGFLFSCASSDYYRTQAVKEGCAAYKMIDSINGENDFQWKSEYSKRAGGSEEKGEGR